MAGIKTYIPGLRLVLGIAHRYMSKWQSQLSGTLTTAQYTCLLSTITAVSDCLAALGTEEVVP